ncbi:MAG TPA: marine proteobacterial sortase target protein [Nitrospira sp.]|nr:marine proteobacterial sortase target protein [Nitrospira sp.]
MTLLNERVQNEIRSHRRQVILVPLLTIVLSWLGAPPVLLACGEPPSREHGVADNGMTLKDVTQGSLLFKSPVAGRYVPAPLLNTNVNIAITGTIARTVLTQEFVNPSRVKDDWAEGIYVFPLPDTAAVDHLRMKVGDRTVIGEIRERAEAKRAYEQAKHEGKRTSVVEQERPNVFTVSVANIAPQDRITIQIEYQETVRYDHGEFSLRFPMVVGPRYIPGTPVMVEEETQGSGRSPNTDRVTDASRITPPVQHPYRGPINPVSLTIDLAAGFPLGKIESPFHEILMIADPDGRRHLTLRQDHVPANRDFQLTWQPAGGASPTAIVYLEPQREGAYGLLMVAPPASTETIRTPPRETIFVIDTSGSMAGTSIEQAKAALVLALGRLTSEDRFNVIQFNSATHVLYSELQPVTTDTLGKAVRYVERLHANGGTEILPALRMALRGRASGTHVRQVIFLTDGQVGNEEELFDVIRAQLGQTRLFTIGIGSAPNSHFMRKAAEFGRGTFTHIGSTSEVKAQMDAIFRKLERPLLTDIQVQGFEATAELFPSRIPDLYDGEPVVLAFKTSSVPSQVVLTGTFNAGTWKKTVEVAGAPARDGLSINWARQKIASLMDHNRTDGGEGAIRPSVLAIALAHHLVSPYTSLIAVDTEPIRPNDASLITHAMKTNLPEGQHYQAIFGLPRTATNGPRHIVIGVLALAFVFWMWLRRYRIA